MSVMYPKPERLESAPYRKYIRNHTCIVAKCWRRVEAHHVVFAGQGRVGSKVTDYQCVPCCVKHHQEFHFLGREGFSEKYSLDLSRLIIEFLILYIVQLQEQER